MEVGDWVKVIRQSTKYNAHIHNVGYVGRVVEVFDDAVQIECLNGGAGAVDMDCVKVIPKPTEFEIYRYGYDRY